MRKETPSPSPRLVVTLLPLCLALMASAFLVFSCRQDKQDALEPREAVLQQDLSQPQITRIVVSMVQVEEEWFRRAEAWAWETKKQLEEKNVYLSVELEISKSAKEQNMLLQGVTQQRDVNAVVVLATGNQARLQELCTELSRQGVLVTAVGSNIVYPHNPDIVVSGDNAVIGLESAKSIVNALGGEATASGRILALTDPEDSALRIRLMNFQDNLRLYPGLKLDVVNYRTEASNPKEAMRRILERENVQYDAVWTGWDGILVPVLQACRESGVKGIRHFSGAGGFPLVAKWITEQQDGESFSDFTYPPRILQVAILATERKLRQRQNGETSPTAKEPPEIILLPTEILTPDNAGNFLSEKSETF